jgi:spermidine/putrescine transport system permease protein
MEPDIAAEICRTMRYSSPNQAAWPLLPADLRNNPAVFPPREVLDRLETVLDVGEATVLFDRLWTEVKTAR